jgi:hypothetical protein
MGGKLWVGMGGGRMGGGNRTVGILGTVGEIGEIGLDEGWVFELFFELIYGFDTGL